MLPQRALNALIDIKKELLSQETDRIIIAAAKKLEGADPDVGERLFRHPQHVSAFQRGCQRKAFWAPVH